MFKKTAATAMALMLSAAFFVNVYASDQTEAASPEAASMAVTEESTQEEASSQVATKEDMAPAQKMNEENLVELTGSDLQEGVYEIPEKDIESSSSMFRIVKCVLTVKDGEMTADLTLSGKGYGYLYMGTGEEAIQAGQESYIGYQEAEDGSYVYTVSLEALGKELNCAAYSKKREKWYDRTLIFRGDGLPKEAYVEESKYEEVQAALPKKSSKKVLTVPAKSAEKTDSSKPEDGEYTIEVALEGGSGKASVDSPCELTVKDGEMTARIQWSSPYFDYMMVDGEKYLPVNEEGNSAFEIPVSALDEALSVAADTTAMSEPHEIDYTLTFDSASMTQ